MANGLGKIGNKIFGKAEIESLNIYENQAYRSLKINYDNFFDIDNAMVDFNAPLFEQVGRVSFEISNICNYSFCHKKCPASRVGIKKVLSAKTIQKVVDELSSVNYQGVIAFHRYNEPLMDPRLFSLIEYANKVCPKAKVLLLTNGFYLTQELVEDLSALNIWVLTVSAYSEEEFVRLSALKVSFPYKVFRAKLDDREDIYAGKLLDYKMGCLAPLRDVTVNVDGNVTLCCLDWKNKYVFGSLERESLANILNSKEFIEVASSLSNSQRCLDICRRCSMIR